MFNLILVIRWASRSVRKAQRVHSVGLTFEDLLEHQAIYGVICISRCARPRLLSTEVSSRVNCATVVGGLISTRAQEKITSVWPGQYFDQWLVTVPLSD
jgi:hypothetical protein